MMMSFQIHFRFGAWIALYGAILFYHFVHMFKQVPICFSCFGECCSAVFLQGSKIYILLQINNSNICFIMSFNNLFVGLCTHSIHKCFQQCLNSNMTVCFNWSTVAKNVRGEVMKTTEIILFFY